MNVRELISGLSSERILHTQGVVETVNKLAMVYEFSLDKAVVAAYLHDYTREMPAEDLLMYAKQFSIPITRVDSYLPLLLHGQVAAVLLRKQGLTDEEILDAISWHTTGKENMAILTKIIYLADYIEPNRSFKGVREAREIAFAGDLNKAILFAIEQSMQYLISQGMLIHERTVRARNELLMIGRVSFGEQESRD